ncbi:hypothetical protein CDAR_207541 [Caerostris darwini]|uniref:Uncharacterized protein n=1 Tax=Caerostris darwini TaxID=1538125 RepID=A0AAV4VGM8_9ARAC|nr:hypothetical protein CDAR_207541 [Caerostris darwini]
MLSKFNFMSDIKTTSLENQYISNGDGITSIFFEMGSHTLTSVDEETREGKRGPFFCAAAACYRSEIRPIDQRNRIEGISCQSGRPHPSADDRNPQEREEMYKPIDRIKISRGHGFGSKKSWKGEFQWKFISTDTKIIRFTQRRENKGPERCWREYFFACCTEEVLAQYITDKNKESRSPQSLLPVIIFINIYHRNRCWLEVHETWKIISFISRGYRAGVIFHRILSCFLASFAAVKGQGQPVSSDSKIGFNALQNDRRDSLRDGMGMKTGKV